MANRLRIKGSGGVPPPTILTRASWRIAETLKPTSTNPTNQPTNHPRTLFRTKVGTCLQLSRLTCRFHGILRDTNQTTGTRPAGRHTCSRIRLHRDGRRWLPRPSANATFASRCTSRLWHQQQHSQQLRRRQARSKDGIVSGARGGC
jgi:hypothetical protein